MQFWVSPLNEKPRLGTKLEATTELNCQETLAALHLTLLPPKPNYQFACQRHISNVRCV